MQANTGQNQGASQVAEPNFGMPEADGAMQR